MLRQRVSSVLCSESCDFVKSALALLVAVSLAGSFTPYTAFAEDVSKAAETFAEVSAAGEETESSIGEAAALEGDGSDSDAVLADDEEQAAEGYGSEEDYAIEPQGDAADPAADADEGADSGEGGLSLMADASGTCGDSATWSLSGGTLTISGTGAMSGYSTSSTAPWYTSRSSITSVVVGSGITSIGKQAFRGLYNMTSVSLPSTLTSLGEAAFYECSKLTSVSLPSVVTSLPSGVFCGCSKLTSINLGNITTIADYALQGTSLCAVSIPAGLTSLSALAFYNASVTSFTVASGNSVYSAKDGVLYTDGGATLALYPTAASATSFTVPAGVTAIGDRAFITNQNLVSLNLGSVIKLGESACQGMKKLSSIAIPDSVIEAGYFTFYGCTALTSVKFGSGLTETSYQMFRACSALTSIDFGSTLTSLDAHTFGYCTSLTSVTLPATITSIGAGCFGECSKLASFTSKCLSSISWQVFLNCSKLTSVNLNEGVTSIARAAFLGCRSLSAVTLPASVSFVHSVAFPTTTAITCLDSTMRAYGKNGYRHLDDISITGTMSYSKAFEVLTLVNKQRTANGLSELRMDSSLLSAAMQRAAEQAVLFAHTRPDSSSCFLAESTMIAENVAYGQATAASVMDSWMNSEGHKANILSASATTIGIGCFTHNGVTYWAQCFGNGSAASDCTQPSDTSKTVSMPIATEEFSEANDTSGVIWGKLETYEYSVSMSLGSSSLDVGGATQATMRLTNGLTPSLKAVLDADCVSWSSANASIASVDSTGVVTGISSGSSDIAGTTGHYTASASVVVGAQTMYRLYNPNSGEHFYTASEAERDMLVGVGWNYEGIGWTAPVTSNTPVYRMYNSNPSPKTGSGEHHYTTSSTERDSLIAAGWEYEGIGWYSDDAKSVPLYRLYNPNEFNNNHHYTTSSAERDHLLSLGWRDEGIAWYGV